MDALSMVGLGKLSYSPDALVLLGCLVSMVVFWILAILNYNSPTSDATQVRFNFYTVLFSLFLLVAFYFSLRV